MPSEFVWSIFLLSASANPFEPILSAFGDSLLDQLLSIFLWMVVIYLAYRWVIEPVYRVFRGVWDFWKLRKSQAAFLEVTPPEHSEKSPLATQQLFTIIRQLIGKHGVVSLEVISSRKEGIRYLMHMQADDIPTLQRHLVSYLPDAHFRVLDELPLEENEYQRVHEVKQARHYAYPLQQQDDLTQSDPVAYIAGAMTKLEPGETMVMQMVLAPHSSYWTNRLANKIHSRGHAIIDGKLRYFIVSRWWVWLIAFLYGGITNDLKAGAALAVLLLVASLFVKKEEPELTPAEQMLYEGVLNKLSQPLFRTDIRILVATDSLARINDLFSGIASSLGPLNMPGFQQLYMPRRHPDRLVQKLSLFKLRHHLPSLLILDSNVLAASELASIYHFPYGTITTEGMMRSHSRSLPAPLAIKNGEFDVILGRNNHHGEQNNIGLTAKERERHMYIIGGTGNGKTTMLQYAIVQDILNGKGVAVVDPHGDLAEKLLRYIPEDRIKDVVYFNPADLAHPIGINLLELPEGLSEDGLLLAQDFATEAIVSIFRKVFSDDDSGGHRIEHILRHAIHTAFTVEGANLFTIQKLLTNAAFRKQVVAKLEDDDLKDFWNEEFGKAGNYQKVKMMSGVTSKIGRFQRSVAARRILEQTKSTISFDEILNGKILICNLSKGLVGEDTSEMFGISILAKLQLAAYRRIHVKESERIPFYLYIDEFQNFATPLFMQMLSESRKYKLFLTMAEQSTSQQDEQQMVETILANVGTVVAFRSGNPADEEFLLPLFQPYIKEGEIANLSSYNFYMKIMGVKAQEPFSGETIVLEADGDEAVANKVIEASRKNYAIGYKPPKKAETNEAKKPNVKVERKSKAKTEYALKKKGGIPTRDGLKK